MADAADVRLLVFDCDGVLTDGRVIVDDHGVQSRNFHVRDGFAIRAAMKHGLQIGVISGKSIRAVNLRMVELGVELLVQGEKTKGQALAKVSQQAGVTLAQTAFVGDDLIDLPAMKVCGYAMAVADAAPEVRAAAAFVTTLRGGHGAGREAVEHILKAQGRWDAVVRTYLDQ